MAVPYYESDGEENESDYESSEDIDDMLVGQNDQLLVAGVCEEDLNHLDVYLYNDENVQL